MNPLVALKMVIGAIPCAIGSLAAFLGIGNLLERYVLPSSEFGRPSFRAEDGLILAVLGAGAIGGIAAFVACLKEWKRSQEMNLSLTLSLALECFALGACIFAICAARDYVWLWLFIPPLCVVGTLLRREWKLISLKR